MKDPYDNQEVQEFWVKYGVDTLLEYQEIITRAFKPQYIEGDSIVGIQEVRGDFFNHKFVLKIIRKQIPFAVTDDLKRFKFLQGDDDFVFFWHTSGLT